MKLITDNSDPQLLGIVEDNNEFIETQNIVNSLNKDLVDSGFDQYQYKAIRRGKRVYIEQKGA